MANPIPGHPCRKLLLDLQLTWDRVQYVFGHDNPKVEKANRALAEAFERLRDAVEWQETNDPEVKALTQWQIDSGNAALRFHADPEFRKEVLKDIEELKHEKRMYELYEKQKRDLERLIQPDTDKEDSE